MFWRKHLCWLICCIACRNVSLQEENNCFLTSLSNSARNSYFSSKMKRRIHQQLKNGIYRNVSHPSDSHLRLWGMEVSLLRQRKVLSSFPSQLLGHHTAAGVSSQGEHRHFLPGHKVPPALCRATGPAIIERECALSFKKLKPLSAMCKRLWNWKCVPGVDKNNNKWQLKNRPLANNRLSSGLLYTTTVHVAIL